MAANFSEWEMEMLASRVLKKGFPLSAWSRSALIPLGMSESVQRDERCCALFLFLLRRAIEFSESEFKIRAISVSVKFLMGVIWTIIILLSFLRIFLYYKGFFEKIQDFLKKWCKFGTTWHCLALFGTKFSVKLACTNEKVRARGD